MDRIECIVNSLNHFQEIYKNNLSLCFLITDIMINDSPILLFDGVCNLCNALVKFVIKRDTNARIKFAPLQSTAGKELLRKHKLQPEKTNSIVYISENSVHLKSDGVFLLLKELGRPWKWLAAFRIIPKFIRDFVYDCVAKSRYTLFGRRNSCMIPTPALKDRFLA